MFDFIVQYKNILKYIFFIFNINISKSLKNTKNNYQFNIFLN
jgi:hypothetical protein